jgi:hypothetical protein
MTVAKRRSSADDKVEAKRKIIRKSLDEITAEVQNALLCANLRSSVSLVVPSRLSAIVRQVVAKRLGGGELRGRPLARAVATAMTDTVDVTRERWCTRNLSSI